MATKVTCDKDRGTSLEGQATRASCGHPRKAAVELGSSGHYLLHCKLAKTSSHTDQGPPHQKSEHSHYLNMWSLKKMRSLESAGKQMVLLLTHTLLIKNQEKTGMLDFPPNLELHKVIPFGLQDNQDSLSSSSKLISE